MASIFDFDPENPNKPKTPAKEKATLKRSKHREELTRGEAAEGKRRLFDMVEKAFATLEAATETADWSTAIKAAQIILDRAGFGPKSTVDFNSTHIDLSSLSREELAERAAMISAKLRGEAAPESKSDKPVTIN